MAEFTLLESPPTDGKEQISLTRSILKIDSPNGALWVRLDLSESDVSKINSQTSQDARIKAYQGIYNAALNRFKPLLDAKIKPVAARPSSPDYDEMFLQADRLRDSDPDKALALYKEVYGATNRLPINPTWSKKVRGEDTKALSATGETGIGNYRIEVSDDSVRFTLTFKSGNVKTWNFSHDAIRKQVNRQGIIFAQGPEDFRSISVTEMTAVSLVKYLLNAGDGPLIQGPISLDTVRPLLSQMGSHLLVLLTTKGVLKGLSDSSLPQGMQTIYYDPTADIDAKQVSGVLSKKGFSVAQIDSVLKVVAPASVSKAVPRFATPEEDDGTLRLEFGRNPNGEFPFSFTTTTDKRVDLVFAVASSWLTDKTNPQAKAQIEKVLDTAIKSAVPNSSERKTIVTSILQNSEFGRFLDDTRKQAKTGAIFQ